MNKLLVTLSSDETIDGFKLLEAQKLIRPLAITIAMTSPRAVLAEHAPQHVLEFGLTSLMNQVQIGEALLPQASGPATANLYSVLKRYMDRLAPKRSLTFIDPYFFAAKDAPGFASILAQVLPQSVVALKQVHVVRDSRKDSPRVEAEVRARLSGLNSTLTIAVHDSADFHDRFWIVDGDRGLFVGSSLNGIGKRVCLVDFMVSQDVQAVLAELQTRGITTV
jgi:hypothetical protein